MGGISDSDPLFIFIFKVCNSVLFSVNLNLSLAQKETGQDEDEAKRKEEPLFQVKDKAVFVQDDGKHGSNCGLCSQ